MVDHIVREMFWRKSGLYSTYEQKCSDQRSISIYYLMATTPRLMWGPTWVICVHSLCTITREQLVLITMSVAFGWYWIHEKLQRGTKMIKGRQNVKHGEILKTHILPYSTIGNSAKHLVLKTFKYSFMRNVDKKNDWTATDFFSHQCCATI